MDMRKEMNRRGQRSSVPQFGAWDNNDYGATNYSVVFQQVRANKKQQKTDVKRYSIGHEKEFIAAAAQHDDETVRKRKILTYLNCCIRP